MGSVNLTDMGSAVINQNRLWELAEMPHGIARRPGVTAETLIPATTIKPVASGTPFGTFGAWNAVGVTSASDRYLTRLNARRLALAGATGDFLVEWAYGAGFTPLDCQRKAGTDTDPTLDDIGFSTVDCIALFPLLPANQQLQCRISDNAGAVNWNVWASAFVAPLPTFTVLPHIIPVGAGRLYPSNVSAGIAQAAAVLPAYSVWVTVIDPAPNDMLVSEVISPYTANNLVPAGIAFQVGIGAAGSEKALATVIQQKALEPLNIYPPIWVKAGERLAIRIGDNTGTTVKNVLVKVYDF